MQKMLAIETRCSLGCDVSADIKSLAFRVERCEPPRLGPFLCRPQSFVQSSRRASHHESLASFEAEQFTNELLEGRRTICESEVVAANRVAAINPYRRYVPDMEIQCRRPGATRIPRTCAENSESIAWSAQMHHIADTETIADTICVDAVSKTSRRERHQKTRSLFRIAWLYLGGHATIHSPEKGP